MVINRVGPLSVAKIAGTLYAILGLVFGAIVSLIAMAGGLTSDFEGGAALGAIMGVGAIVALPILRGWVSWDA
jgi:hypothetical protein